MLTEEEREKNKSKFYSEKKEDERLKKSEASNEGEIKNEW